MVSQTQARLLKWPALWLAERSLSLPPVSSDHALPLTGLVAGQVTEVTCPVIGRAQPELTPSKRQKIGPYHYMVAVTGIDFYKHGYAFLAYDDWFYLMITSYVLNEVKYFQWITDDTVPILYHFEFCNI